MVSVQAGSVLTDKTSCPQQNWTINELMGERLVVRGLVQGALQKDMLPNNCRLTVISAM